MSAFLMFVILAVATDTRAVGEAAAIAIGGTIGLDAMFGGPITGASMNPMRSLGPALVSGDLHALWLYIVAPIVGASLGGLAYQFVRGEQARRLNRASGARPHERALRLRRQQRPLGDGRAAVPRERRGGRHEARSAGSEPGDRAAPAGRRGARRDRDRRSGHVPRKLDREALAWADSPSRPAAKRSARLPRGGAHQLGVRGPEDLCRPAGRERPKTKIKRRVEQLSTSRAVRERVRGCTRTIGESLATKKQ